jgi:hypothetical protein
VIVLGNLLVQLSFCTGVDGAESERAPPRQIATISVNLLRELRLIRHLLTRTSWKRIAKNQDQTL